MESVLIISVIVCAVLLAGFRRRPQPQIIYVVAQAPQHQNGLGCLPLLILGALVLVALDVIGF
jgi:hypothetical protein